MSQPLTLNQLFFDAVDRFATKRAAVRYKADGVWRDMTHHELARRVHHAALGLLHLGIRPGDRVAILSHNRPEWAIADFACLTARCADVPIYPTLPSQQVAYLLRDSGARAIFVADRDQYAKIAPIRRDLPQLEHIIVFDGGVDQPGVVTLQKLLALGAAAETRFPDYRDEALAVTPDDLATLIYTSGTTGDPKGVMLTHGNFTSNVLACLEVLSLGPNDTCLSFLPLSHSFERTAGHYVMLHGGCTINYAESIDTVPANMVEVHPTVVLAVPRLYEKIYARVLDNAVSGGAIKRRIFFWARKRAETWADLKLAGKPIPALLELQKGLADRLVFAKLRARTGGRIRYFVSGAAPLAAEIARFFYAAGLPIIEGYGLTETSPVVSVNRMESIRIGTVGPPIRDVEVRIAPDGEVLVRGPNVMRGYYNRPEATAEAIDVDRWFHTGDIGELADGYLKITDRKKDLIVTAGGKKVAPQPIENLLKTSPFVLNAVMLGDRRKFPILLVVPNRDALEAWAAGRRLNVEDGTGLFKQPDVVAKVEREVMLKLRDLASYEMPKKILLLERDFSIEGGELTPTLKVKRKVVEQHYQQLIDSVYQEAEQHHLEGSEESDDRQAE